MPMSYHFGNGPVCAIISYANVDAWDLTETFFPQGTFHLCYPLQNENSFLKISCVFRKETRPCIFLK